MPKNVVETVLLRPALSRGWVNALIELTIVLDTGRPKEQNLAENHLSERAVPTEGGRKRIFPEAIGSRY